MAETQTRARSRPAPLTNPAEAGALGGRLGGPTTFGLYGRDHMKAIGAKGQSALRARLAREWDIPDDAPDRDERIDAALRVHMTRLRQGTSHR